MRQIKQLVLFLTLSIPAFCCAQFYTNLSNADLISFRIKPNAFNMDTTSFVITDIIDDRNDKSRIGVIYFGPLETKRQLLWKEGMYFEFTKYFEKGFQDCIKGEHRITAVFKDFLVHQEKPDYDPYEKTIRKRHYHFSVEYYLTEGEKKYLIFQDSMKLDTVIRPKNYLLETLSLDFFKSSFRKLEEVARNDSLLEANIEKGEVRDTLLEKLAATNDTIYQGQMIVQVRNSNKFTFKGYIFTEDIQELIKKTFIDREKGKGEYIIEYIIAEKDDKINFLSINFVSSYKAEADPLRIMRFVLIGL